MNERLKAIIEKHNFDSVADYIDCEAGEEGVGMQMIESFVKSIVAECVNVIAIRKDEAIDGEWNVDEAMSIASFDIADFFGVE